MVSVGPPHVLSLSSDTIHLSYWVFALWWLIILGVHLVTCTYNALYAFCYWKLEGTYLNLCLEFYRIGMPQPYHYTIAITYATMSALHGVCIVLMLGGSVMQCSLAFTPWSSCQLGIFSSESKAAWNTPWFLLLTKHYNKATYSCGVFGVNGKYFEVMLVSREIVETTLQTVQAYRMSALLPRTILNRFYIILLGINCWSSVIFRKHDKAYRRFACIFFDCFLDLMVCMGVELIVLFSYVDDYDPGIKGFDGLIWYDDEWVARALNEFQIIVVVTWSDLVIRTIFSLGLVITTTNMKKLLAYQPRNRNRVAQSGNSKIIAVGAIQQDEPLEDRVSLRPADVLRRPKRPSSRHQLCTHSYGGILHATRILFAVWGSVVLGLHIHASLQPTLPQCLMQVRPWTATKPSCYLAGLDCHMLGISGNIQEVQSMWSRFDASTVVQLLIRHCSTLEVPDLFREFHGLRGIKIYNTTIIDWSDSAAITNANHAKMSTLFIVRVNMTDGLLPAGFQSLDFPQSLNDIEMCATNLREVPDDIDVIWPQGAIIQVEYSQLTTLPLVLARLKPYYLYLTGNLISELPPEIFEVEGMVYLGISETNIRQLPRNVTNVSPSLSLLEIGNTKISFFWSWVDQLVGRVDNPVFLVAGGSTYCDELEHIENGTADAFSVSFSTQYSAILMNTSEANRQAISQAVDCNFFDDEPFYPLAFDDNVNALQDPSVLPRLG